MWVFNKSFDDINEQDIQDLLKRAVGEQQNLEYKEISYGKSDGESRNMLKDVSSFANAFGGYLIIGIKADENGISQEIFGIDDAEEERDRIQASCLSCIDPRINGLKVKTVPITDKKPVVLILIPRSPRAPHMVTHTGLYQFWSRHDRQNTRMAIEDIKEACLRTENIRKSIDEFIEWRRSETLEEIKSNVTFAIGIAPLMVKDEVVDISDPNLRKILQFPPDQAKQFNLRFYDYVRLNPTLHGLKIETHGGRTSIHLLRNCSLEFRIGLHSSTFIEVVKDKTQKEYKLLKPWPLIFYTVNFFRLYKTLTDYYGLVEPLIAVLSIYNTKGFALADFGDNKSYYISNVDDWARDNLYLWQKTHLEVPPFQLPSLVRSDRAAEVLINKLWNAFEEEVPRLPFRNDRFEPEI